jgi:uncharacterized protein
VHKRLRRPQASERAPASQAGGAAVDQNGGAAICRLAAALGYRGYCAGESCRNGITAMPTRRSLILLILLASVLPGPGGTAQPQDYATATLTIVSASGPHRFTVELAATPAQMEQGLMFRRELAPDAGMLFDFKTPTVATMWMRNTLIPLDMLFVGADGRIVNIHQRAVPQSDAIIAAAAPVRAVIELNGGTAARLGIKPGDQVIYPIFGSGS